MNSGELPSTLLGRIRSGFIPRDTSRSEEDDFKLSVLPKLEKSEHLEALPVYEEPKPTPGLSSVLNKLIGWRIKNKLE